MFKISAAPSPLPRRNLPKQLRVKGFGRENRPPPPPPSWMEESDENGDSRMRKVSCFGQQSRRVVFQLNCKKATRHRNDEPQNPDNKVN